MIRDWIVAAPRWKNDQLNTLKRFTGNDFQAVDESGLRMWTNYGRARQ